MVTSSSQCWNLFRTCQYYHSHSEFVCVSVMALRSYFLCIFYPYCSCTLSASLSTYVLSPERRVLMTTSHLRLCVLGSLIFYTFSYCKSSISSHFWQQEGSIVLAEWDTKYGNNKMLLKVISGTIVFRFPLGSCLITLMFLTNQEESDMGSL